MGGGKDMHVKEENEWLNNFISRKKKKHTTDWMNKAKLIGQKGQ